MFSQPANSRTVDQLVALLQNPLKKALPRRKQPIFDRDQIKKHMRLPWREPGYCNIEFAKAPITRAKILNEWELERINMAARSYVTPKNSIPYHFDQQSRDFPKLTIKLYPKKFQRYLKDVESEKEDLLFKEKRAVTNISTSYQSVKRLSESKMNVFAPISPNTRLFGFSTAKQTPKTHKNKHFKTLNI